MATSPTGETSYQGFPTFKQDNTTIETTHAITRRGISRSNRRNARIEVAVDVQKEEKKNTPRGFRRGISRGESLRSTTSRLFSCIQTRALGAGATRARARSTATTESFRDLTTPRGSLFAVRVPSLLCRVQRLQNHRHVTHGRCVTCAAGRSTAPT